MEPPIFDGVDAGLLSGIFGNVTNSYKYYWFLSILDEIKDNPSERLSMDNLALRMVSNVWFPLNYYRLSFGKKDGFVKISDFVTKRMSVDHSAGAPDFYQQIKAGLNPEQIHQVVKMVKDLLRWVPYRFVRPFFVEELQATYEAKVNQQIVQLCDSHFDSEPERVLYKFEGDFIRLNPVWIRYFQSNQQVLRGFAYWHLVKFLQRNNPNVPGIPEKLFRQEKRRLGAATTCWRDYIKANSSFRCIYSGELLLPSKFTVDHFLPWSFVVHDQLWNLIPTPQKVNSSKSDQLPDWDRYFGPFSENQFEAVQYHASRKGGEKTIEDYLGLFSQDIRTIKFDAFQERLKEQLFPQLQIARNMGFGRWVWKG